MNLIKFLVLPLFTLFSVANAYAPIVTPETSQTLEILRPFKIVYDEEVVPVVNNALVPIKNVYNSNLSEPASVKGLIRQYFGDDADIMIKIAQCESGLRQFSQTGEPIRSHTFDYGLFQINEEVWDNTALKMGLNYKYSMEDNVKMANYILDVQGFGAWVCLKYI